MTTTLNTLALHSEIRHGARVLATVVRAASGGWKVIDRSDKRIQTPFDSRESAERAGLAAYTEDDQA